MLSPSFLFNLQQQFVFELLSSVCDQRRIILAIARCKAIHKRKQTYRGHSEDKIEKSREDNLLTDLPCVLHDHS